MAQTPLDKHIQRLRQAGYKLTHARLSVLKCVMELGGHCTSSDVLEAVMAADDNIGRASVFRTLDLLTQLGIIRPTYIESSATPHYIMMPGGHHHHVICTNCNEITEFDDCGLEDLERELEKRLGVQITGHLLEFYALCDTCQQT
jgi:Fur family transcriptional regulator, ferric uptake regulator